MEALYDCYARTSYALCNTQLALYYPAYWSIIVVNCQTDRQRQARSSPPGQAGSIEVRSTLEVYPSRLSDEFKAQVPEPPHQDSVLGRRWCVRTNPYRSQPARRLASYVDPQHHLGNPSTTQRYLASTHPRTARNQHGRWTHRVS